MNSILRAPSREWRFLLWLALPFTFYIVPVLLGYSWNALGENHNVLNPPEGYDGRLPDMRITVEAWGTSVVVVPLHARLRQYVTTGQLPLWNPYQGLGEPFAAEGDGSPYFPSAIVWALLPYAWGNYVTFAMYYLGAVFLYLFLRGLTVSEEAAIFGGVAYALSGALSLFIARPNIADQLCMIPVLFWGAGKALRERTVGWYAVFAVITGLHAIAGFIQIAMITALLVAVFCVAYGRWLRGTEGGWGRDVLIALGVFVLGNGLAAFSLWPMLEAQQITYNTRKVLGVQGFEPIPEANLLSFVFPFLFGHPFKVNWLPGTSAVTVNWDNLYGFTGIGIILITIAACARPFWKTQMLGQMFNFFLIGGVLLMLRYLGVPPVAAINLLPVIREQAAKHSNGLTVYCFVVAAALGIDALRKCDYRYSRWLMLGVLGYFASFLLTLLGRQGGLSSVTPAHAKIAVEYVSVTIALTLTILFVVWFALVRLKKSSDEGIGTVLTITIAAELSFYIPLGNSTPWFLYARLGLFGLVILLGLLLAFQRKWMACAIGVITLAGYVALIGTTSVGLPRQFNVDAPQRFMGWLRARADDGYRTFGIAPDFSSIDRIQDISSVGPLSTQAAFNFINLTSDKSTLDAYLTNTHFMLAGPWQFDLNQYLRVRPVFDWVGVRYLVLDKEIFRPSGRTDYEALLRTGTGVRKVYEDGRVMILESAAAAPKADFSASVAVYPAQAAILDALKNDPGRILGMPMVEEAQVAERGGAARGGSGSTGSVRVEAYQANEVRLELEAPQAGIVVLKDSYFPGWEATLNGQAVPVVRVDAMVRGVLIPHAGRYEVVFRYWPVWFTRGLWMGGLIILLILSAVLSARQRRRPEVPGWAMVGGIVLATAILVLSVQAYLGRT